MKRRMRTLVGVIVMFVGISCYSQTVDSPYEVGTWHRFRQTAINYTFDDGTPNQFTKVIPMFNELDFDLTLFTVTNWTSDWARLQNAVDAGHEVASHTVSHPNFSEIDPNQERIELMDSRDIIESHITGQRCNTIAYAYCVPGDDSICDNYYIAARGCQGFIEPSTPGSIFNVSSVICGTEGAVKTLDHFKSKFESAAAMKGWCVFLLHGIDGDGGYSSLASTVLSNSLDYLNIRRSKFWVTTFRNTALYVQERNAVNLIETSNNDSVLTLEVTDTLVDSVYNFPLSVRRPLPLDWPSADVTQNTDQVFSRIVQVDTVVYLTFDVIPDGGEVVISKNNTFVQPAIDTIPVDIDSVTTVINTKPGSNDQLQVTILNNSMILKIPIFSEPEFTINLYDLKGVCVMSKKVLFDCDGSTIITLPKNTIPAGIYIVGVANGNANWTKKISYNT
jgi:hypothetical protein